MEKDNKKFTIGYLDEEEQWKLMFRNSLKSDFLNLTNGSGM